MSILPKSALKSVCQLATQAIVPNGDALTASSPRGLDGLGADPRTQVDVKVEEVLVPLSEVGEPVRRQGRLEVLEDLLRDTPRGCRGFQEVRGEARNNYCLCYTVRAVIAEVPDHLPRTHRVTDQVEIVQVQGGDKSSEVRRKGVVVVADRWLARLTKATPIVGYDPVAGRKLSARSWRSQARPLSGNPWTITTGLPVAWSS